MCSQFTCFWPPSFPPFLFPALFHFCLFLPASVPLSRSIPPSLLRQGCRAWRTIRPVSHCVSVYANSIGSPVYHWAPQQFHGCLSFGFRSHGRQIYSGKGSFHIAPARNWSETVCDTNKVVGTKRKHHQGFYRQKAQQYLIHSLCFSYTKQDSSR